MSDPRLYRFPNLIITMLRPSRPMPPNTAQFRVPLNVNKPQIANYIEQLYNVKVKSVRTVIFQGKERRMADSGRGYKTSDWKKAFVQIESRPEEKPWTWPSIEEQKKMKTS